MYDPTWNSKDLHDNQYFIKDDWGGIIQTNQGALDPVEKKIFNLSRECETYFYYLLTAEQDDYIWSYYDGDETEIFEKSSTTLLKYLQYYVEKYTLWDRFSDLTEEQVKRYTTGRLLF